MPLSVINLLLIEDNEGDANLLLSNLEESNEVSYTVDWIKSIDEFSIDTAEKLYDVILLDLSLPNLTVLEIFDLLHEIFPEIPIIVLTTASNENEAIITLQRGAQDVISKDQLSYYLLDRAIRYSIERKQMAQEMVRTQKLETIGILAGGIAHDFNNILTSILGNISLVKMEISQEDQPEIFEILGDAELASLRAKDLANQLLTFSKGGAPIKKTTNLFELIHDTVTFALRGSNVRCNLDVDPEMWAVNVDPNQIHQVLNNVIINANQAMPNGGEITIQVKNIQANESTIRNFTEGKFIEIAIHDQGVGISAENLSKIFDPYFTYGKDNGSGLGLTTSYSIIKRHEGDMWAESEIGVGSTLFILLPASSEEMNQIFHQAVTSSSSENHHYTILIMDDEIGVRTILAKMLKRLDYSVIETANGVELIEAYEASLSGPQPVDVLILDLTIPGGLGGEKAMNILRKKYPHVKAIVSSGYSNDPIMANYSKFGFDGVLMKPFTIKNLKLTLSKVLNTHN